MLLGTIARGVADGAMTHQEGVIILHTLLSAGGESTTSLLGNAVRILAEHPDLQQQLRDDPTLVPAFVEEAVRLESPFRYLLRSVPADTTLGGVDIPADATLLLFWSAANRDPDEFDHPDDIVLDREVPRHHVAFGRGIHHCVGAPLARLEARVVLTRLLAETASITLDPDHRPRRVQSLLVRRHETLPVVVTPRLSRSSLPALAGHRWSPRSGGRGRGRRRRPTRHRWARRSVDCPGPGTNGSEPRTARRQTTTDRGATRRMLDAYRERPQSL